MWWIKGDSLHKTHRTETGTGNLSCFVGRWLCQGCWWGYFHVYWRNTEVNQGRAHKVHNLPLGEAWEDDGKKRKFQRESQGKAGGGGWGGYLGKYSQGLGWWCQNVILACWEAVWGSPGHIQVELLCAFRSCCPQAKGLCPRQLHTEILTLEHEQSELSTPLSATSPFFESTRPWPQRWHHTFQRLPSSVLWHLAQPHSERVTLPPHPLLTCMTPLLFPLLYFLSPRSVRSGRYLTKGPRATLIWSSNALLCLWGFSLLPFNSKYTITTTTDSDIPPPEKENKTHVRSKANFFAMSGAMREGWGGTQATDANTQLKEWTRAMHCRKAGGHTSKGRMHLGTEGSG